jgi:HAE1 family hydrophobic/amphiphilic exporter-1
MTALAFIFGCLPLWVASGSGAASRRILGTVVVGGMTLSTVIGLIFIPATFAVVEYLSHRFTRGGKGTTMDSPHHPDAPPGGGSGEGHTDGRTPQPAPVHADEPQPAQAFQPIPPQTEGGQA